jgi:hypothetical protein
VLSLGVGAAVLLLLPFWYRSDPARLVPEQARRGATYFATACILFLCAAAVVVLLNSAYGARVGAWIHPVYWWPVAAAVSFAIVLTAGRRVGFEDVGRWMHLFGVALLFVGFQFVACIAVLGQGLAAAVGSWIGYGFGGLLFAAICAWMVRLLVRRIRGDSPAGRLRLFIFMVTENVFMFVGLMIWAKWPHGAWHDDAGHMTHEGRQLLLFVALILATAVIFSVLIASERRSIRRVLGPPVERVGREQS